MSFSVRFSHLLFFTVRNIETVIQVKEPNVMSYLKNDMIMLINKLSVSLCKNRAMGETWYEKASILKVELKNWHLQNQ